MPRTRYSVWILGAVLAAVAIGCVVIFDMRRQEASVGPASPVTEPKVADLVPIPNAKSIAVLPFANFSPDKDNEFFADGLQDEVITALAKIHDLKVISRTSVLAYRNPEGRNLKKIGNELGVATVLEGSVQRIGGKVHLNVQLIDSRSDDHIWAESYTEDLTDVFSLESALAQRIADALKASLTTDERALIGRRPTQNQEAYDLYLRARVLQENLGSTKSTTGDSLTVLALFEQSAAKDPLFSLPHVQASIVHGAMFWFSSLDSTEDRRLKALDELKIAQRLAPSAPETRLAQGEFDYQCLNDWNQALSEYRAAALGLPNDAQVHYGIGRSLRRLGRFAESIEEFKKAASLNPNDDTSAFTIVEMVFSLRRFSEAVELGRHYGERFPQEDYLKRFAVEAQYQVDGDRAAFLKAANALDPFSEGPAIRAYRQALLEGDLLAAEHALSDPSLKGVLNQSGSISEPVALHRAYVAYLLGKAGAAKEFSDQAISAYRNSIWTHRQQPWVLMGIAMAEAYEGRGDDAVRDGEAALDQLAAADAYDSLEMRFEYGKILVICDRRKDALSVLGEIIARPGILAPRSFPFDPVWSRLKNEPRFEEILNSVKPL